MTQCTSGWKRILSSPSVYNTCMWLLGAPKATQTLVEHYIRPQKGMRILDLGCGPASILKSLPEDIEYIGADISPTYIDAARDRYPDRGTFHCLRVMDMAQSNLTDFDLVMGIGVLHHLDNDEASSFFSMASTALAPGGRCLTIDPCFVDGQKVLAKALISRDRGRNVRNPAEYVKLAKQHFSRVDQVIRHDMLRIPYSHAIAECKND